MIDAKTRHRTKTGGNPFVDPSLAPKQPKPPLARHAAQYELDDGPLSRAQVQQVRTQVPQGTKRSTRSDLAVVAKARKIG
jgi:hypothetical protein